MNNARRKELKAAVDLIQKAQDLLLQAAEALEAVQDGEQEAFDNMPESLQESSRGEQMQENIDALQTVQEDLQDIDFDLIYDTINEM